MRTALVVSAGMEALSIPGLTPRTPSRSYLRLVDTRLNRADLLVPAGLVALGAFELLQLRPDAWGAALAVELVAASLLVWRRTVTLIACTSSALVLLLLPWIGPQLDEVAAPILYLALVCYSL